jgi:translocation and assembly module TamB
MEVDAETHYASLGGAIDGQARSTRGGTAALHVGWTGNLLERVKDSNAGTLRALNLQSDIEFHRFPVGVIPALSDRQVRGLLSGEVQLRGLGSDARLQAKLDGAGMTINGITLSQFRVELTADNQQVGATLDAARNRGNLHAELSAPSSWGQRLVPIIDPHAKAKVKAREFQLAALSPLFLEYVSTLEGLMDADLSMEFNNDKPTLVGTASLRDGVFQIPQVGQRFSDAQAKITVRDDEIRVDSIQARGITGRLTGEARAKLSGTELISASAQLDIKDREKLPVTFEGVMIGDAWGHIRVDYAHADSKAATEIKVDVPELHLKMPDAAQNGVQALDPAADIRIGTHRSDGKFVVIAVQPFDSASADGEPLSLTRLLVHLGGNVWVERGRQAKVQLAGNLEIDSGSERKVAGRIELKGGQLDVSGKRFEIERGVISFAGSDASNPTVTATARWDSPASYTVYADYVGSVKDGKLKLHSEPSLSQDEILSLLLFGSPDGSIASGSSGVDNANNPNGGGSANAAGGSTGSAAAVGVAGGTATKGLNRAISDVTNLDVSTRIDTSTGSARPELDVQLTPRLTTRVTRALGAPLPGQSPDMTFVTLELRLRRSWALSGTVGDHGASTVDLIWRKRY